MNTWASISCCVKTIMCWIYIARVLGFLSSEQRNGGVLAYDQGCDAFFCKLGFFFLSFLYLGAMKSHVRVTRVSAPFWHRECEWKWRFDSVPRHSERETFNSPFCIIPENCAFEIDPISCTTMKMKVGNKVSSSYRDNATNTSYYESRMKLNEFDLSIFMCPVFSHIVWSLWAS